MDSSLDSLPYVFANGDALVAMHEKKDYALARDIYEKAFTRNGLSDERVKASYVANYAFALAKLYDSRASSVLAIAESKAESCNTEIVDGYPGFIWFTIAQVYGVLNNVEGTVKCLTKHSHISPCDTVMLLSSEKNKNDDPFLTIRGERHFIEFEEKLVGQHK